jgi:chromate transporter
MRLLWELFYTFFKIGTFTFGGGLAMLPLIRKTVVEEKGWLNEEEVTDCFAVAQSLPGVLAVNAAIYVGYGKKALAGAVAAVLGVVLPAFASILVILLFLGRIEDNPYVHGAFEGVKAASAALILLAAYKMGKRILKGRLECAILAGAFALVVFTGIGAVWAIVFGGLAGYVTYLWRRRKGGNP